MTKISKMMSRMKKVFSLTLSFLMILGAITSDMSIVNAWSDAIGDAFAKTLSLKIEKTQLNIGEIIKATGIADLPEDAKITSWKWSSDNEDVATVSGTASEANVEAKALGKAKITAIVNYQEKVENSSNNESYGEEKSANANVEIEVVDPNAKSTSESNESSNTSSNTKEDTSTVVKAKENAEDITTTDDSSFDPKTEQYIRENIDKKYAKADQMILANGLYVKHTLADASKLSKNETIDSLMGKDGQTVADSIYTMITASVALYDTDSSSKYYVAYANTMQNDKTAKVKDYCFALFNINGEVIKDAYYDYKTGLAYVPKSAMQSSDGKEQVFKTQVQFLQAINKDLSDVESKVEYSTTDDGEKIKIGSGKINALDLQTKVKTEKNISKDEMTVSVNGVPLTNDNYNYNQKTGTVTINQSSVAVQSVNVDVHEKSAVSKLTDKILGIQEANAVMTDGAGNALDSAGRIDLPDSARENDTFQFTLNIRYNDDINDIISNMARPYGFAAGDGPGGTDLYKKVISGGRVTDPMFAVVLPDGVTPRDVNLAVNAEGLTDWKYQSTGKNNWIPLRCNHLNKIGLTQSNMGKLSGEALEQASGKAGPVYLRILNLNDDDVLIGFITPTIYGQTGCSFIRFELEAKKGNVSITKKSADTSKTDNNSNYSVQGAKYQLKDGSGNVVANLTTDANGNATATNIKAGDYKLVETEASKGYKKNDEQTSVTITPKQTTSINGTGCLSESPKLGTLKIKKVSENPSITNGNQCYSLKGAVYELKDTSGNVIKTLITDDNGKASANEIPLGKYTLTEKTASPGYAVNKMVVNIDFTDEETKSLVGDGCLTDKPTNDPLIIEINKLDLDTGEAKPSGDASLENAQFYIRYYAGKYTHDNLPSEATRTWIIKTRKMPNGKYLATLAPSYLVEGVKQDDFYYEDGMITLPIGTLTIEEKEAPEGYRKDNATMVDKDGSSTGLRNGIFLSQITQDGDLASVDVGNYPFIKDGVKKQRVQVQKQGISQDTGGVTEALQGVEFKIYLESALQNLIKQGYTEQEIINKNLLTPDAVLTTDELGRATSKLLPYGTYRVVETKTVGEYDYADDFLFTINDESIAKYGLEGTIPHEVFTTVLNKKFSADLQIVKRDSETGDIVKLEGAKFKVKTLQDVEFGLHKFKAGEYLTYVTQNDDGTTSEQDEWTTGTDGKVRLPARLFAGEYELTEIQAPTGYQLDAPDYRFKVTKRDCEERLDGTFTYVVNMRDTPSKGKIQITKKGEMLVSVSQDDLNNYKFKYEEKNLQGATFRIVAEEDILNPANGEALYKAGETVETIKSGDDGIASSSELPLGKYYVEETQAPTGYALNGERKHIELKYKDQNERVDLKEYTVKDARQKLEVTVNKQDGKTFEEITGAKFKLVTKEAIVDYQGNELIPAGTTIETRTTNNGHIDFLADLPLGNYKVEEVSPATGYARNETSFDVNGTYTNQLITINRINYAAYNDATEVEFAKVDKDTKEVLSGATLELYDSHNELVDSWTTTRGTNKKIRKLNVGEQYTLKEVKAPTGYLLAQDKVFTVRDTNEVQYIEMSDASAKGTIKVTKRGQALTGVSQGVSVDKVGKHVNFKYSDNQLLSGAVFEIRAKENIAHPDGVSKDLYKKGDLVTTITTGNDGTATTKELPLGQYEVTEKTAPDGYLKTDAIEYLTLSYKDQNTEIVTESTSFNDERQTIKADATKKDATTKEPLAGAQFTLYAKENIYALNGDKLVSAGDAIETVETDENGQADFESDLPLYQYTVCETKAPTGYNSTSTVHDFDGRSKDQVTKVINGTFEFANKETQIEFTKKDNDSDVITAGNILQVFDKDGKLIDEWTTELNKTHIVKKLHVGETYTFVEKLAAEGYLKANTITFTVDDQGDAGSVQKVQTMYNEHEKGKISVEKRGQALVSATRNEKGNIVFNYEEKPLAGAVFEITATENIKHPDGVSQDYYQKGDVVATITTGDDGIATTDELPLGKYTVREVTAPNGYQNNSETKQVALTYADQDTKLVFDHATYLNNRVTADVSAIKYDSETKKVVEGAEFTLYADRDITNYNGEVIVRAGDKIETQVSNKNGIAQFVADLPLSVYKVKETKNPNGYHSTATEYTFDATYQGQDVPEIVAQYEFNNIPTEVEISKQDITNEVETAGNILQVFDSNGDKVDEWTSKLNESHKIKYLTTGETYTLVERLAADGYLKANDIQFTVEDHGDNGGVQKIVPMKDEHAKAQLVVEKHGQALVGKTVDEKGNITFNWDDRGLAGAEFTVYARENIVHPDGVSGNIYFKGDVVEVLTTGADGKAASKELPLGKYRVVETKAPNGYLDNEENVKDVNFVYKDQFTAIQTKTVTFDNERQTIDLSASKKDSKTNEKVAGAEFTLTPKTDIVSYDGDVLVSAGNKIETVVTDENGNAQFQDTLPLAEYTISETKAPNGYHSTSKTYDFDGTYQGPNKSTITGTYEFTNIPTKVKLSKQDITTNVETAGNFLQVIDKETGEVIDEWVSELDTPHYIEYLTTGKTYTLVEKLAATGYLKANDIDFTVEDYGDNGGVQEVVPMKDELVKGKISVEKRGEVLVGKETNKNGNITFKYEEKGLAGATYNVYAKEDIKHPDGKTENFYDAGDLVTTLTTGEDGTAQTDELPLGKYYVEEATAPNGFVLNKESKDVTLSYEDQFTPLVFDGTNFKNERQTVELDAIKKDSKTNEKVAGATFTLTTKEDIVNYKGEVLVKAGEVVQTSTTDKNGHVEFTNTLPLGQYTVAEVKAPDGYHSTAKTYDVDASYKGQDVNKIEETYEFTNIPTKVKISKQDITTNVETAGNFLQVVDKESGKVIDEWVSELDTSHYIEYLTTGKTYTLVEKLAATGYLKANDIDFTVVDDGDNGRVQEIVPMKDELVKGQISVEKQGEVLVGTETNKDGSISFKYETRGLANAVYEVYAKEDIKHPDEKTENFYNKGDLVGTITTDETGKGVLDNLPLGQYEIKEKTAPEGFVLSGEVKNVTLSYKDQFTPVVFDGTSFTNKKQDVEIKVKKQDQETDTLLEGAEFALYTDKDILDVNGKVLVKAGTEIEHVTTDETGTGKFKANLPLGEYTVKETKAPKGYASKNKDVKVDANYKGQTITVVSTEAGFKNKQIEFDISKKSITTGEELPGATLTVYPADKDGNPIKGEAFDTWVSTDVPHKIKGLEVGKEYVLVENVAPFDDGYVTSESVRFTVKDTEEIQKVEMVDDITKLDVYKVNKDTNENLAGATLAVYPVDEDGNVKLGECFAEWLSTDEPHRLEQIPVGKYVLRELTAPFEQGYVTADDVEFEVKDTPEVQTVTMKDGHTTSEFVKTNVNGDYVAGATMSIIPLDDSGNPLYGEVFDTWLTDKDEPVHTVEYLPVGKYLLVENSAPEGYVKAKPVEFEVTDTEKTQSFQLIEKQVQFTKTDVTGDKEIQGAEIVVKDEDGNEVDHWTSTDEPHNISGLEEGKTYTLIEKTAPDDYVKAEKITFEVTTDKENQKVTMKDKQVSFTKTDVTGGKEIEGATITVTDEDGKTIDEWVSTKDAHYIQGLEEGKEYTLTETTSPEGYVKAESIKFEVTNEKVNQTVTMKDKQVSIKKTDITNGKEIPGAKLEVTDKETNEVVDKWTSTEEAHNVSGLEEGKTYILTETTAPNGYDVAESIEFTVTNEKVDQVVEMKDAPFTTIQVNKVDSNTKQAIVSKDFEFTMYSDAECKNVIKTVNANQENGTATFENVGFGTYYIKETKAPLGYLLSDEVKKIVVDETLDGVGGIHSFVYENTLKPVEVKTETKTGDNTNIIMPTMLLVGSGIVAGAIISNRRKKESLEDSNN